MIVVNFGGGTNSTALLVGAYEKNLFKEPPVVVFADTGSEMPHTYTHLKQVGGWLAAKGAALLVTRWIRREGTFIPLHEYCLSRSEMPSKAYGFSGCTTKWKQQPIDRLLRNHAGVQASLSRGEKVERWIGYDADEPERAQRMFDKNPEPHLWVWKAPLVEWGWGRDECVKAIERSGLPQPGKSSCFMCPSMRKSEVLALAAQHPEQMKIALEIEARAVSRSAEHRPDSVLKGLGRRGFAWKDLVGDKTLPVLENHTEVSCGCYDGD